MVSENAAEKKFEIFGEAATKAKGTATLAWIDCSSKDGKKVIVITSLFTKLTWPGDGIDFFYLQVKLTPTYHTWQRLHTISFYCWKSSIEAI